MLKPKRPREATKEAGRKASCPPGGTDKEESAEPAAEEVGERAIREESNWEGIAIGTGLARDGREALEEVDTLGVLGADGVDVIGGAVGVDEEAVRVGGVVEADGVGVRTGPAVEATTGVGGGALRAIGFRWVVAAVTGVRGTEAGGGKGLSGRMGGSVGIGAGMNAGGFKRIISSIIDAPKK